MGKKQKDIVLEGLDDQALITAVRQEIERELGKCTQAANPGIFARLQSREGYRAVEQFVIDQCLHNQLTPSAAIGLLESEISDD